VDHIFILRGCRRSVTFTVPLAGPSSVWCYFASFFFDVLRFIFSSPSDVFEKEPSSSKSKCFRRKVAFILCWVLNISYFFFDSFRRISGKNKDWSLLVDLLNREYLVLSVLISETGGSEGLFYGMTNLPEYRLLYSRSCSFLRMIGRC